MEWKAKQNLLDRLVEWSAAGLLAASVGWAGWQFRQPVPAMAGAALCLLAGVALLRRVGGPKRPAFRFEAGEIVEEELLLDDPLPEVALDSRVVRMFAQGEATPGEMVARIADYLADPARSAALAAEGPVVVPDGREALHAALANIRATLR